MPVRLLWPREVVLRRSGKTYLKARTGGGSRCCGEERRREKERSSSNKEERRKKREGDRPSLETNLWRPSRLPVPRLECPLHHSHSADIHRRRSPLTLEKLWEAIFQSLFLWTQGTVGHAATSIGSLSKPRIKPERVPPMEKLVGDEKFLNFPRSSSSAAARNQLLGLRPIDSCQCRTDHCLHLVALVAAYNPESSLATLPHRSHRKTAIKAVRKSPVSGSSKVAIAPVGHGSVGSVYCWPGLLSIRACNREELPHRRIRLATRSASCQDPDLTCAPCATCRPAHPKRNSNQHPYPPLSTIYLF